LNKPFLNARHNKLLGIVLLSLTFHAAILYLVVGSSLGKQKDSSANISPQRAPIQAKLIFNTLEKESKEKTVDEVISESSIEISPAETIEVPNVPDIPTQVRQDTEELSLTKIEGNTQQIISIPAPKNFTGAEAVKRQFSTKNQRQLQNLAAEASRQYQELKTSPILKGRKVDPFVTEEEKLLSNVQVKVDCSSTTNKVIAAVSGFAGGMLKCSRGPEISGFIQDRLDKTAHLPAKNKTEER
jgi:hypothetical protein